jgi:CRP/FNR family cyclic AMP-dependent transcriptional regulator
MKSKRNSAFNAQVFLESVGASRRVAEIRKKQAIFSQGDTADSIMYIQKGSVKFTVVNERGKEAVVAIFGSGDFFGEGAMAGQTIRMGTATAIVPTTVLIIGKNWKRRNDARAPRGTRAVRPFHQLHACTEHPS